MVATRAIAPAAALCLSACAPSATRADFDSPVPASRLYAIEKAVRTRDATAVPRIVELLDSDDPLVRMMAIEALKVLREGETFDYEFDDPDARREEAIRRWVESLQPATASTAGSDYSDG